jgi:hypothetical protein
MRHFAGKRETKNVKFLRKVKVGSLLSPQLTSANFTPQAFLHVQDVSNTVTFLAKDIDFR